MYPRAMADSDCIMIMGSNMAEKHPVAFRWQKDDFFQTWLVHYTNAATIIHDDYKDPEENNGVFSGLLEYQGGVKEWNYNGFVGEYKNETWQYKRSGGGSAHGR